MKAILFLILTCMSLIRAKVQPNIVLIMANDVGCEPIGAYGGDNSSMQQMCICPTERHIRWIRV
jgi:hypothetical protein